MKPKLEKGEFYIIKFLLKIFMKLETYNFVWNYPNSLNRKKLNLINKWTKNNLDTNFKAGS